MFDDISFFLCFSSKSLLKVRFFQILSRSSIFSHGNAFTRNHHFPSKSKSRSGPIPLNAHGSRLVREQEKVYPRKLKLDFHHQYFGSNKPINFSLASHKDMTFIMFSKNDIFNFKFHYSRYRLDRPLK